MNINDVKVTNLVVSFTSKFPTQNYGNIEIGRVMTVEVQPGQDVAEVSRIASNEVQRQVRETLAPIAAAIHKTQITPLLENLPEQMRKDIESKFGVLQALNAMELAAAVQERK